MSSILSHAVQGLHAAGRQFETAARSAVSAGSGVNAAALPEKTTNSASPAPGASPASGATSPPSAPAFDLPDLAASLVDIKQAETSYKAQLEVLAVADRLEDEAIDLLA